MVTQFFGHRWDASRVDDDVQTDTPVGELCLHCEEPIEAGERGIVTPMRVAVKGEAGYRMEIHLAHLECDLHSTLSHIFRQCNCYVPDQSLRDGARATMDAINAWRATEGLGPM